MMEGIIKKVKGPTLLIDESKCRANMRAMAEKFAAKHIELRPHLKTPQSAQIAQWLRDYGVNKATVSSVQMAKYFAAHGWDDLCIAFPFNPAEAEDLSTLSAQTTLSIVVTNEEQLDAIEQLVHKPALWVKINTGTNRTGIPFSHEEEVVGLFNKAVNLGLKVKGLLAHSGHTYHQRSVQKVEVVHTKAMNGLRKLKSLLETKFGTMQLSYGDTPACTLADDFEDVDEVRPGNFIFYDLVMSEAKVCSVDRIGVAMACPIVAKHAERQELILYGGAVHFSKDSLLLANDKTCYGKIAHWTTNGWQGELEEAYIRKLSQEHGVLKVNATDFDRLKIGDIVAVLPVHSCLTADLMTHYYDLKGGKIEKFKYRADLAL